MHDEHGSGGSSRTVAYALLGLLGLTLVAGLALAGWLSLAAVPRSAIFGTLRTPSIHDTASALTEQIDGVYSVVFWISAIVFVGVEGAILFALFRFRRRPGDAEPPQWHGNNVLEVTWTIIPAILVIGTGIYSFDAMRANYASTPADADSLVIQAVGQQWWWSFAYDEPAFTTTTEMVVPVGRPVKVYLDSVDVLHAFWVPELAVKFDAVPGRRDGGYGQNLVWFNAKAPGRYEGQCAELCGTQHAGMRFSVIAVEPAAYDAWAAAMAAIPPAPAEDEDSPVYRGYKAVQERGCQACHAIDGVETMVAHIGPNLTRVATRSFLAGGVIPNTHNDLLAWISNPDSRKVGSKMQAMGLTDAEIGDVIAYFESMALPSEVMRPVLAAEPRPSNIPSAYAGLVEPLDTSDYPPLGGGEEGEGADDDAHGDEDGEARAPDDGAQTLESSR